VNEQSRLSGLQRVALIGAAIAVLIVAYVVIQGGSGGGDKAATSSSSTATGSTTGAPTGTQQAPAVPTVRVVDAKPQGGVQKLEFKKGDQVRFRIVSDTADEIHVHGYDFKKDVPKGGSVSFSFKGSIEGRFVVELESRGEQIAELDVTP
jgi:hypothetical protein